MKELESLQKTIEYVEDQLEKAPAGFLRTGSKRGKPQYCHVTKSVKRYLSVEDEALITALAIKAYHKKLLVDLKNERDAISKYIAYHREEGVTEFLQKHERINNLIRKGNGFINSYINGDKTAKGIELLADNSWVSKVARKPDYYILLMNHVYTDVNGDKKWNYEGDTSAPYQEKRTHATLCGINVRSKSEMIIANELYHANILFLYEPELLVGNKVFHPDFLIFHPFTGEVIIWEHGGMFFDCRYTEKYSTEESNNSCNYTRNFAYRTNHYISNGWIPGINLIITSETAFTPIDTNEINHIIGRLYQG